MENTDNDTQDNTGTEVKPSPRRFKLILAIIIAVAVVVVISVVVVVVVLVTKDDDDDDKKSQSSGSGSTELDEPDYSTTYEVSAVSSADSTAFTGATTLAKSASADSSSGYTTLYYVGTGTVASLETATTITATDDAPTALVVSAGGKLLLHANILIQTSTASTTRTNTGSVPLVAITGASSYASMYGVMIKSKLESTPAVLISGTSQLNMNNCTLYSSLSSSSAWTLTDTALLEAESVNAIVKGDKSTIVSCSSSSSATLTSVTGVSASAVIALLANAAVTTKKCTLTAYGAEGAVEMAAELTDRVNTAAPKWTDTSSTVSISSSSSFYDMVSFIRVAACTPTLTLTSTTCTFGEGCYFIETYLSTVTCAFTSLTSTTTLCNDKTSISGYDTMTAPTTVDLTTATQNANYTISTAGVYILSGELAGGSVIVNTAKTTVLRLQGVTVTSPDTAAIAQGGAGTLKVIVDSGTNILTDGSGAKDCDYDGCLFSAGPLIVTGEGVLTVKGQQDDGEGVATQAQPITFSGSVTVIINSADDGVNAGGTGGVITIGGDVSLFIHAGGDGIDSNYEDGISALFNGGLTYVMGSSAGGDAGIDTDGGFEIHGGTVIALGSDMLEEPNSTSTQYTLLFTLSSSVASGTTIVLTDDDSKPIIAFVAQEAFQTLILSSPSLAVGTYHLYSGGTLTSADISDLYVYSVSSSSSYTGGTQITVNSSGDFKITSESTFVYSFGSSSGGGPGGGGGGGQQGGGQQGGGDRPEKPTDN